MAVLALAFSLVGIWPLVGAPFAIPAVVCGHMALREMRTKTKRGSGIALAGLVLGYIGIAGTVAMVIWMFVITAING